jgi:hypothetical protein
MNPWSCKSWLLSLDELEVLLEPLPLLLLLLPDELMKSRSWRTYVCAFGFPKIPCGGFVDMNK